jgi:hypothetical protein
MKRRLSWVVIGLGVLCHAGAGASEDLTLEGLTAQEWRVFSDVFPTLPRDGYAIRFRPQRTVETANLARVASWTVNDAGELALLEKDGETVWTFRWYPDRNLLVSCPRSPQSPVPPLVLAPPGSTIASVDASLRALGLSRCGPDASR